MIKEPELFSLEKRRNEEGTSLFLQVLSDKTGGSRHKLKPMKFHLSIRKKIVMVRVDKHRHRLPIGVVESPSSRYSDPD